MLIIFVNFVLLSMAEGGKLLPLICKQYPDAEICNGTGMFSSIDQAEGDLMSTVCKKFPDAEICKDPGLIPSMEQEGEKLLKQAEGELLPKMQQAEGELLPTICKLFPDADICNKTDPPIDINLTSGLKRQMERGGNQMEQDIVSAIVQEGDEIVSAIVQEGDALISGIEQMLGDLFSAIEKEDDSIVSAIEKEGKQMERQEAPVITKRHPGAAWEEEERFGPHNMC